MNSDSKVRFFICLFLASLLFAPGAVWAAGNTIMYQGTLAKPDGTAVPDGTYPMTFAIYDALEDGTSLWNETGVTVQVTGGAFAAELGSITPFGNLFESGAARWLEIAADLGAGMNIFDPRVPFTMVPHAGDAATLEGNRASAFADADHGHDLQDLDGAVTDAQVPDDITVSHADTADSATTAGNADTLDGKHGTSFSLTIHSHKISDLSGAVTDAQVPDTITVNNADTVDGNHAASFWNILGNAGTTPDTHFLGTTDNVPFELRVDDMRALRIEPHAESPNLIGGFNGNTATTGVAGATIGGGGADTLTNRVTDNYGTISGGINNQAGDDTGTAADKKYATVGGGGYNKASGHMSTVGGGNGNNASGEHSTVGGGDNNIASGKISTVGGGYKNRASGEKSTVGGGGSNNASGEYSTVGGGFSNEASGKESMVPGGRQNTAQGDKSFAAGCKAKANHIGSFVWGDSTFADVASSADNQFTARAAGGVRFFSNAAMTTGVELAAGGGAWTTVSDRNQKENFAPIDCGEVLDKVSELPLSTWNYKSQDPSIRHLGPMAQDLHAAFGLGETDTGITTIDADGVALAAIQGLNQRLEEKDGEIAALRSELATMKSMMQQLADK